MPPEPDLDPGLIGIWRAWKKLSNGRSWISGGFGATPQPIAWRDIKEWCDHYGYAGDWFELYVHCFDAMDAVFLKYCADRSKVASEAAKTAQPRAIGQDGTKM